MKSIVTLTVTGMIKVIVRVTQTKNMNKNSIGDGGCMIEGYSNDTVVIMMKVMVKLMGTSTVMLTATATATATATMTVPVASMVTVIVVG